MKPDADSLYYFERLKRLPEDNGMYTDKGFHVGVLGKVHEYHAYDNLPVARSFARRESEVNPDRLIVIAVLDDENCYGIYQVFVNRKEVKL